MKYNIVTIENDPTTTRGVCKMMMHYHINATDEVKIPGIDGKNVNLPEELEKRGLHLPYPGAFSVGEIGVWLSMFDCWQWSVDNDEELIVFEDDALVRDDFDEKLAALRAEIPDDYDFVALWIPENQHQDYLYLVHYDEEGQPAIYGSLPPGDSLFDYGAQRAAMVYNGYGNVAQLFSPKGSKFFIDTARKSGIYTPVDCFQYQEAHAGRCKGYAPKPEFANLVRYEWPETTVHNTQRYGEIYK